MTIIAIIYHSTYGHTKLQADAVLRGAECASGHRHSIPSKRQLHVSMN